MCDIRDQVEAAVDRVSSKDGYLQDVRGSVHSERNEERNRDMS